MLQNKICFLPTDPTVIGMGRWRGNTHYFKSGLTKKENTLHTMHNIYLSHDTYVC